MKKLSKIEREALIDSAIGRIESDLIITDVRIFNVFTKEIYPGEIYIKNGYISYIEQRKEYFHKGKSKQTISGKNQIAVPGFIDSHMHIESSMLTPQNFSNLVIPKGTTTIVTDPHEIGNVMGLEGVNYMIEAGKHTHMYQYILAPSCVPAVPELENSGAIFNVEEIEYLLNKENVIGIAEVMDYYGAINKSKRMRDILDLGLRKNTFIQGHFFGENPKEIAAYLCSGPKSNHEFFSGENAKQALEYGMIIDARNSSFSRNLHSIVDTVKSTETFDRLTLCTDDREPEELIEKGHIDDCLRDAVKYGLSFEEAIKSVTIIPANHFNLKQLGALAPGYIANINLIDSPKDIKVSEVFFEGKLVAKNDEMIEQYPKFSHPVEEQNTVDINGFNYENLRIKTPINKGKIKTRVISYKAINSSLTEEEIIELSCEDGYLTLKGHDKLNFIAVINRYSNSKTYSLGIVKNFHLENGALAGTVSHDSHNLIVVFNDVDNAIKAIEEIRRIKGGIVYSNNEILHKVEFPIAGLMSPLPASQLIKKVNNMNSFLKTVGIKNDNPIMRLATSSLPVVPTRKISDLGILDTINQKILPLFI